MEYERIHKVQTGMLSPSKLRMKLLGPQHQRKKDPGNKSSRSSPSKIFDPDYSKDCFLGRENTQFNGVAGSSETTICRKDYPLKDINDCGFPKTHNTSKGVVPNNPSTVHPIRSVEDENFDNDAVHENAISSAFEFHKGEKSSQNWGVGRFSRPIPSKWNDAEKWIVNRQSNNMNLPKKNMLQRTCISQFGDARHSESLHNSSLNVPEKFSFTPLPRPINGFVDRFLVSSNLDDRLRKDEEPEVQQDASLTGRFLEETNAHTHIPSISMRDMGTEMTPVTSQEPSQTSTPIGAATPIRSATPSMPSTPRREPTPSPLDNTTFNTQNETNNRNINQLSEKELQLETRREIMNLGIQLGKMNIAVWAKTTEIEQVPVLVENPDSVQVKKQDIENRATAWEEAEKSKHAARYKREEIKIQAWENRQRSKAEAQMRKVQARAERMKKDAQKKMKMKLAITKEKSEKMQASAEARKNRQASKTAHRVELMRQTGRISSSRFTHCIWYS